MEELVDQWRGRRVFVTGHTGFKGGWLALWLAKRGAEICGYALDPTTEPNLFGAASLGSILHDVRGDIRNRSELQAALTSFQPEVVFHLAAQPLVRRSYVDPLETYATNVMGTAHVLEAVRTTPSVRAIVCVTTDKCYLNREWGWPYRETDLLGGFDPYSSSKACAEIVTAAYRSSFFAPDRLSEHRIAIATARAGNVIGGGDWSTDRLIPDLIRGFQASHAVAIRYPKAIRPWQHVLESLSGYLILAEKLLAGLPEFATAFNFGPADDEAWSVEDMANKMVSLWGGSASWTRENAQAPHEAHFLRLDSSKARAELGWRPRLKTETALEWTIAWYQAHQDGKNMQRYSELQIAEYEKLST